MADTEMLGAIKTAGDCDKPGTAALQHQLSGIPDKAKVPSLGSCRLGSQKQAGSSEHLGQDEQEMGPHILGLHCPADRTRTKSTAA